MSQHFLENDRLEKALEAMMNESVTPEQSAAARARVWAKLAAPAAAVVCAEFQPKLPDYLEGRLPQGRRMLLEDHLGRCPQCRRELATLKGERKLTVMPPPRLASWPMWKTWAVAAGLAVVVGYAARHRIDSMLAPGGPRMTVVSVSGTLYRVPAYAAAGSAQSTPLAAGATLGERDAVRTGPGSHAVLRLADGSIVEVNERSELSAAAAWSGRTIHLQRGDVIVQAAKQRRGSLRVQTRDSLASVQGTVFAVSAGVAGSVVSVVEGAVQVRQPGRERVLHRGEQAASNPALEDVPFRDRISWSRDSEKYLALLADFAKIEKQIRDIPPAALRTQTRLLQYLPADTLVYGAIPNISGTIRQTLSMVEQQASQSQVFREWWESRAGRELKEIIDLVQAVTPMLGEEIALMLADGEPAVAEPSSRRETHARKVPLLVAEVLPGRREALANALAAIPTSAEIKPAYHLTDQLLVMSDTTEHLQWALPRFGRGAASPFATEIGRRYQRGVGWLVALDFAALPIAAEARRHHGEAIGTQQIKYLFLEQRALQGGEENEVTVLFQGPRTGINSWLASGGTSGAAEHVSSDAVFAVAASTRQPRQLFDELAQQLSKVHPRFQADLLELEAKLGVSVANDIAGAIGTDFAFAIERPAVPIPAWIAAVVVHNPASLDATIRKLVDVYNSEAGNQERRLIFEQETVDGRVWNSLKSATAMSISFTWTYDRGYLVAGADRALVSRAIATRNGGFPLIWSAAFRQQLPASTPVHPSAFAWLNTRGALQGLAQQFPAAAGPLGTLVSQRDPVLIVVNGETEQIHAASRTRLSSLVLDLAAAQAAARASSVAPASRR